MGDGAGRLEEAACRDVLCDIRIRIVYVYVCVHLPIQAACRDALCVHALSDSFTEPLGSVRSRAISCDPVRSPAISCDRV